MRVRSPISVSRSLLRPYYFQAPAAQSSLVLDLLRQCLCVEIKEAIKAGSPLYIIMDYSPSFQQTILFILYYLQFTLSGISFVLDKHLEDKLFSRFRFEWSLDFLRLPDKSVLLVSRCSPQKISCKPWCQIETIHQEELSTNKCSGMYNHCLLICTEVSGLAWPSG